jgi:Gram-negative bacterial TonB protein C-terminal
MRRMILATLVLFPVLANAQASTSTERQLSNSSATLHAELKQPAGLYAAVALAAGETKAAAASASMVSLNTASHAMVRESVQARFVGDDFVEAAVRQGGTLEYSMVATPMERSEAKVTRAVEIDLSQQELAGEPVVSNVVVHATVDEYGIPRNVLVTKSAGQVIDQKAIAAVSQYRFKPATLGNQPKWSTVSIAIKIQKQ